MANQFSNGPSRNGNRSAESHIRQGLFAGNHFNKARYRKFYSAWKAPRTIVKHQLHLDARDESLQEPVFVDFKFELDDAYPDVIPKIDLVCVGINKYDQLELKKALVAKANDLLGQEMVSGFNS